MTAGSGLAGLALATGVSAYAQARAEAEAPRSPQQALAELRLAIRARPDLAGPWLDQAQWQLAGQVDQARVSAQAGLHRDPRNWRGWQLLGLVDLELGHEAEARADFTQAARLGRGFAGHYQLANFAILLGDAPVFWSELRAALGVAPVADVDYAVNQALAFAHGPDDPHLLQLPPAGRPAVARRIVRAYLLRHYYNDAAAVLRQMRCDAAALGPCRAATSNLVNTLLPAAFDAPAGGAHTLVEMGTAAWSLAVARGWVRETRTPGNLCADGDFKPDWGEGAFSWDNLSAVEHVWVREGPPGGSGALQIQFDGQEPEQADLFRQLVPVAAGRDYEISYQSRALATSTGSGLVLEVLAPDGRKLASVPAALHADWTGNDGQIAVPAGVEIVSLRFAYHRPSGEVRLGSPVQLAGVRMEPVP